MALVGGSVTITSAGVVTGTGLAEVIAIALRDKYDRNRDYQKARLAEFKADLADAKAKRDAAASDNPIKAVYQQRVDSLEGIVTAVTDGLAKNYDELAEKANALGPAIVTYFTANATVSLIGVTADDDGSSHWPVTKSGSTDLGIT